MTYKCTYDNFESHELTFIPGGLEGTRGYEMCSVWSYYGYPRGLGYTGLVPPLLSADVTTDGGSAVLAYDPALQAKNEAAAKTACPAGAGK